MTTSVAVNAYAVGVGTAPNVNMVPFISNVAPASTNITGPNGPFKIGQPWVDTTGLAAYTLVGLTSSSGTVSGTWALSAGGPGTLSTLTGNSGGAISPVAGNINVLGGSGVTVVGSAGTLTVSLTGGGTAIDSFAPDAGTNPVVPNGAGLVTMAGTANQITTTGGLNTLTFSVPSTFIAPGTIASTTTLTAGSSLSVTTSAVIGTTLTATGGLTTLAALTQTGTTLINASGAGVTTIGTGGTGAVNIGNATGNTAVTGSLTATTTLTATLGAITATNGNLVMGTAGNKIIVPTGANASAGTSAAMSGTPGAVTVATTASSGTALIFYARNVTGGTMGNVSITAQDGTGFTLTSDANETSTFNWWIINA